MPTIDWDKWNRAASFGLPKNRMWGKLRSGEHDADGNPLYLYETKPDVSSTDPALADVLAAHRFTAPPIRELDAEQHCFCGWSGSDHAGHLEEKVREFTGPESVEEEVAEEAPKPRRRVKKSETE